MKHVVLIIGDSHAKGYLPHTCVDSDAIGTALGTPAELCQAVSGSTADDWAQNFSDRLNFAIADSLGVEAVLVSLGGNDAFKAAADGTVSDFEVAALCVNLAHVLREIAVHAPRVFVLLYGYPFAVRDPVKVDALRRLNAFIAATAATVAKLDGVRIELIDESDILDEADWPGDDIHPFVTGYNKIGREIARRLEQ